jgi:hypothetical protein
VPPPSPPRCPEGDDRRAGSDDGGDVQPLQLAPLDVEQRQGRRPPRLPDDTDRAVPGYDYLATANDVNDVNDVNDLQRHIADNLGAGNGSTLPASRFVQPPPVDT